MNAIDASHSTRALTASTVAFTVCFAVWTIFSIIGLQIRQDLHLSKTEFGLLGANQQKALKFHGVYRHYPS